MASRAKTLGASMTLAGVMISGCVAQKTADEELLPFATRDGGVQDAAMPVVDAATVQRCTNTDPIAQLLCQLTPQSGGQTQQPATVPDLSGLLGSLGGLGNIANVLGTVLGTPGRGTNNTNTGLSGLVDLVNLAGGLANIAQLFNQLLSGQSLLTTLFNGGGTPQQQQPTSIADFLRGLGIPVAGSGSTTLTQEPTANQCANPTTPAQQFACALQQSM